jgi:hypothetical protein
VSGSHLALGVRARVGAALRSDWLFTLLLSVCYFQLVWGFKIADPRNLQWILDVENDLALYLTTTSYFRFSEWSFPVTRFHSLLYPVGTSISAADAVPLLAVPFKLLDAVLPRAIVQYFGAWLFLCVWAQAIISKKIFRLLGVSVPLQWLGTVLMTADLPQAMAVWHFPLWAHFLFTYGFYLVLQPKLPLSRTCGLLAVAPWVTPYLFVMVLAACTALFIKHRRAAGLWKQLALAVAVTLASCFLVGYFHFSTGTASEGEYMADLTTLFNSGGTGRLGPQLAPLRIYDEGYGYLGLGGIFLFLLLLVKPLIPSWRRRVVHAQPLAFVCLLMALYAFSTHPLFRGHHWPEFTRLHAFGLPIFTRLRATGRFIWPLWHYIILFGVRAVHELFEDKRFSLAVGGLVLALQIADVGPWLAHITRPIPDHAVLKPVSSHVIAQLTPESRFLLFSPRVICTSVRRSGMWGLALFGALHRLQTNTDFGSLARWNSRDMKPVCRATKDFWRNRKAHPEVVFVEDRWQ